MVYDSSLHPISFAGGTWHATGLPGDTRLPAPLRTEAGTMCACAISARMHNGFQNPASGGAGAAEYH
ncbi:hypothetical protein [uncultured Duncaniella sp.]|uniref:hypothetical protein n=1 Tax=uncultured Duncaniella sp. TaxID=2768039 RepID=UPI00272AA705|nr:hypothetical protein [uncultured Duncaniella sp.]